MNMKKILFSLFVAAALTGLSCKSAPTESGVKIEGEVTQEKVNQALKQIYSAYYSELDLSGSQSYTVEKGDTLSQITRRYYGNLSDVGTAGTSNGFYFPIIMMASGNTIVDPDLIEPGLKLTIPDLKKNLAESGARKAIKDCIKDVSYVYNKKGHAITEEGLITLADSL
jgi:hypothetical protein